MFRTFAILWLIEIHYFRAVNVFFKYSVESRLKPAFPTPCLTYSNAHHYINSWAIVFNIATHSSAVDDISQTRNIITEKFNFFKLQALLYPCQDNIIFTESSKNLHDQFCLSGGCTVCNFRY